jgi:hypothetical protein
MAFAFSGAPSLRALNPHWETEPRVPAGNPDGGQWTRVAGLGGPGRPRGHHYVPRSMYRNESLQPETRKVFENATTGQLLDERNNLYDKEHRQYNDAVLQAFQEFKRQNGVRSEEVTPDQAREFLKLIQESRDPLIRNLNMRMLLREIMKRIPKFPRGME